MQVKNGNIYREATKVVIKYNDVVLIDGFVENDVISWVIKECEIDKDFSVLKTCESQLKKTKDVMIKSDVINNIYFGLQVHRIKTRKETKKWNYTK